MNLEDFRITEFRNQTYKCFRNGLVFKLMKTGEWNQVGNTPHNTSKYNKCYYRIRTTIDGKTIEVKIHRLLAMVFLGLDIADKTSVIDHLDGNGLNNDLTNIRICTQRENDRNRKNVKGVSYNKKNNQFQTTIRNNEGQRLRYSNKDHDTVLRWRQEKEIEFGYMTRSTGIRT